MSHPSDRLALARHVVTAVLVSHDGARWLPEALAALKAQERAVQRFVVVDTGSRDESREIAVQAIGGAAIVTAPRTATFGAAVGAAVRALEGAPGLASTRAEGGEPVEWLWLLHDDSAPAPDALLRLLELADDMPSAGVLGPKLRDWDDRDALTGIGFTVDRGGRRDTALERGEIDQGQHDRVRDVLAVSSAGMLVRRDVWATLGGFDAGVPSFRDDLDFCWRARRAGHRVVICPPAVVFHAEAAASGKRSLSVGSRRPRRMDREAALRILLTQSSAFGIHANAVRLFLASVLRAVLMVLAKRPTHAWDELRAMAAVFGRPGRMLSARRRLRAIAVVPAREAAKGLLAPHGSWARHRVESLLTAMGARPRAGPQQRRGRAGHVAIETGPSEAPEELVSNAGLIRGWLTRPGVMVTLALLLVTLVAERGLLASGALFGGALLPAPAGASDLWHHFFAPWHPVGLGSDTPASPAIAVVAALATLLFGHAGLAVGVLLLGSVPLAGISAYLAVGTVVRAPRRRMWAAAAYALLPVLTGAVAGGRLGSAVAVILLPFVAVLVMRATLPFGSARLIGAPDLYPDTARVRPRTASIRAAWGSVVVLAIAAAFDPITYLLMGTVALLAGVVAALGRRWRGAIGALIVVVFTPVLLLPWSWYLFQHPARLLLGMGRIDPVLTDHALPSSALLALQPGGPAMPPSWLYGALFLAALAALALGRRSRQAGASWLLAIVGLVGAVVVSRITVATPDGGRLPGWPGVATALLALGLITATLAASHGLRGQLRAQNFGWRQPLGVVVTVALVAAPVLVAVGWMMRGAGDPLQRGGGAVVPELLQVRNELSGETGRTLVLRPAADGVVTYTLVRGGDSGPTLGDGALRFDAALRAQVDAAVADLAGAGGIDAAEALARYGVRYVMVETPRAGDAMARAAADRLRSTLSNSGGVSVDTASASSTVWQVQAESFEVSLVNPTTGVARDMERLAGDFALPTGTFNVPYAPYPRYVAIAEAPSGRWHAALDGKALARTTHFGKQAFEVPAGAGTLVIGHNDASRGGWLWFELAVLAVAVILTLPGARHHDQPEPDLEATTTRHGRSRARVGSSA